MIFHAFLIKYAEIAIKGKNRYIFEDALVKQMNIALSKVEGEFEVKKEQGRIYVFCPEQYDYDEQKIINNIINNRKRGKKHHIIINAEGIGHSTSMARRIEAATGVETRATILGYMQRGGSPTCRDRVYATMMGAMAVDLLCEGICSSLAVRQSFAMSRMSFLWKEQKCIWKLQRNGSARSISLKVSMRKREKAL